MRFLKSISPQDLKCTAVYYVSFIALGLSSAAVGPTLPALAEQTGVQLKDVSSLFITMSVGYLLGTQISGRLYDRMSGHRVMAAGLLIMAVFLALVPLANRLWLLTLLLFFVGAGQSFIDVGANALIVWLHGQNVSMFMNGLHLFFGVGTFLTPLIVAASLQLSGGIAWSYIALAVLALPAIAGLLRLDSPHAPKAVLEKKPLGQQEIPLLLAIMLFFFLAVGYEGGFGGWIYTYALKTGLAGEISAAYLTSTFWGAFTLGRLLGFPAAGRFKSRTILAADLGGSLASLAVILAFPGSPVALWIGTAGLGLSVASIFPGMLTFASSRMALSGRTTSLIFAAVSLSGIFFPWYIGQSIDTAGPRSIMLIFLVTAGAALAVFVGISAASRRTIRKAESR